MISVNEFYKNLLDNLNDGVYFTDSARKITYFNKAAERITGYKSSEVVGSGCSDNILVHVNEKGENLSSLIKEKFDFRPLAIIERLGLRQPIFQKTAAYGHFTRPEFPWEKVEEFPSHA